MRRELETIKKIEKAYREVDDQDSLTYLSKLSARIQRFENLKDYAELDVTKAIVSSLLKRYKTSAEKLMSDRTLTDRQRELLFLSMDHCQFTVGLMGVNAEQVERDIKSMVASLAEKVGIEYK